MFFRLVASAYSPIVSSRIDSRIKNRINSRINWGIIHRKIIVLQFFRYSEGMFQINTVFKVFLQCIIFKNAFRNFGKLQKNNSAIISKVG